MRRRRREGVAWDRHYEESDHGRFMRSTYEGSSRRLILRMSCEIASLADRIGVANTPEEPNETIEKMNRRRDRLRMVERAAGIEMFRVRLASGL